MDYLGFAKFMENVYTFPLDELSVLKDDSKFLQSASETSEKSESVREDEFNVMAGEKDGTGESCQEQRRPSPKPNGNNSAVAQDPDSEMRNDRIDTETEGAKTEPGAAQVGEKRVVGLLKIAFCPVSRFPPPP